MQGFHAADAHPHQPAAAACSTADAGRPGFQIPPLGRHQHRQQHLGIGHNTSASPAGPLSMPAMPSPAPLRSPHEETLRQQQQQSQHKQVPAESPQPTGFQFGFTTQPPAEAVPSFNPFSEELPAHGSPWLSSGPRAEDRALQPVGQPMLQQSNMTTQARSRLLFLTQIDRASRKAMAVAADS